MQLFFKHVICALEVLNALYTIYIESVYYLIYIYMGLYANFLQRIHHIVACLGLYIFIYINARIKVFI